jgi:taurine dioxygenase
MTDESTTILETPVELDLRRLSGTIGAEITGLDLHRPLDRATTAAVRRALVEHKVLFFPGQYLGPAEHVAFARQFGPLTPAHPVVPGLAGHPEIFEVDYTALRRLNEARTDPGRRRGEGFHTDVTFMERPPLGSILNAVVMPAYGGDTIWADTQAAYDGLSASLRALVDGLSAVHDGEPVFGGLLRLFGRGEWDGQPFTGLTPTTHPVVRTHPESGRRGLFVNPGFTHHLVEMTETESRALLDLLYRHMTSHEYLVRHHWTPGDLAFWDNRSTMHCVVDDYGSAHRVIQRVTLQGDRPT